MVLIISVSHWRFLPFLAAGAVAQGTAPPKPPWGGSSEKQKTEIINKKRNAEKCWDVYRVPLSTAPALRDLGRPSWVKLHMMVPFMRSGRAPYLPIRVRVGVRVRVRVRVHTSGQRDWQSSAPLCEPNLGPAMAPRCQVSE